MFNQNERSRAVVCLSGGLDSCLCAALAARDYETYALHVSYGQRTEARELRAAREVSSALGLRELLHLKMDLFRRIGGSALRDTDIAVPDAPEEISEIGAEVPVTYVPFRNAHFLAAAVSWAEVLDARPVLIGAVEAGQLRVPGLSPSILRGIQPVDCGRDEGGRYPCADAADAMRKREIVEMGVELDAPFHVSWSCYLDEQAACGRCESCALRLRAFAEAGRIDPLAYAAAYGLPT